MWLLQTDSSRCWLFSLTGGPEVKEIVSNISSVRPECDLSWICETGVFIQPGGTPLLCAKGRVEEWQLKEYEHHRRCGFYFVLTGSEQDVSFFCSPVKGSFFRLLSGLSVQLNYNNVSADDMKAKQSSNNETARALQMPRSFLNKVLFEVKALIIIHCNKFVFPDKSCFSFFHFLWM